MDLSIDESWTVLHSCIEKKIDRETKQVTDMPIISAIKLIFSVIMFAM